MGDFNNYPIRNTSVIIYRNFDFDTHYNNSNQKADTAGLGINAIIYFNGIWSYLVQTGLFWKTDKSTGDLN